MSTLSALLEIAIVLAAIYVGLSCLCSAIDEQIASIFKLRGAKLYEGVLNLLVGEKPMVDAIFAHPLIAAASDDRDGKIDRTKTYRPSYVDARNFSMAFWQSVREQQSLPSGAAAAAALAAPNLVFDELLARVQAMPPGDLQRALVPLIYAADGDYQKLLSATDGWFNAQMDRVSGWYKRQAQGVLAIVAAAIVIVTGIDSIEIGTNLYFDQGLRKAVVDSIAGSVGSAHGGSDISGVEAAVDREMQGELGRFFHFPTTWRWSDVRHLPGMFVTFVALLLGGPFWFDALSGLVNVRLAGRRPERDDQPPK